MWQLSKRLPPIFGTAMLFMLPFWVVHFYRFGSPFEGIFVGNHYHYPTKEILDTTAGGMVFVAVFFSLGAADWALRKFGKDAYGAAKIIAFALLCGLYAWFGSAILYRLLVKLNVSIPLLGKGGAISAAVILGTICGLWVSWKYRDRLLHHVDRATTALGIPIGVVVLANFLLAGWQLQFPVSMEFPLAETKTAQGPLIPATRRVVWMIFDGWDQGITFEDRDPTAPMPHTDRLAAESFWAQRAVSPTPGTLTSVVSMMTGRRVVESARTVRDFNIRFQGAADSVPWSTQESVFSDAQSVGMRSAILMHDTQAHPYCRILHAVLNACWEEGWWTGDRMTAFARMDDFLMATVDLVKRYQDPKTAFDVPRVKEFYERFKEQVVATVCDTRFDLVYVHWMLPHSPFFYDRVKNAFMPAVWGPYERRYSDNLVLTDRTIGEMFAAFEKCGANNNTAYILTADHGQAGNQWPVFMAKLPGERKGLPFAGPAELVKMRALIAGILRGRIRDYGGIKAVFEKD